MVELPKRVINTITKDITLLDLDKFEGIKADGKCIISLELDEQNILITFNCFCF